MDPVAFVAPKMHGLFKTFNCMFLQISGENLYTCNWIYIANTEWEKTRNLYKQNFKE
jgi:hypothetical protein